MPVKLIRQFGVAVIRLFGDLDTQDLVRLKNLVAALMEEGSVQIVVDFERIQHINAAGLGLLAECLRGVRLSGGDLRLAGLSPYQQHVFELTGVKRSFRTFGTAEAAAQSFSSVGAAA